MIVEVVACQGVLRNNKYMGGITFQDVVIWGRVGGGGGLRSWPVCQGACVLGLLLLLLCERGGRGE